MHLSTYNVCYISALEVFVIDNDCVKISTGNKDKRTAYVHPDWDLHTIRMLFHFSDVVSVRLSVFKWIFCHLFSIFLYSKNILIFRSTTLVRTLAGLIPG